MAGLAGAWVREVEGAQSQSERPGTWVWAPVGTSQSGADTPRERQPVTQRDTRVQGPLLTSTSDIVSLQSLGKQTPGLLCFMCFMFPCVSSFPLYFPHSPGLCQPPKVLSRQ